MRTPHEVDGRRPPARSAALAGLLLTLAIAMSACGDDGKSGASTNEPDPAGNGTVTVVYDDAGIKPENKKPFDFVKQSGVLEKLADWVNTAVALPNDMTVTVSDKMPPGIDDMATAADGQTIWVPGVFLTQIYDLMAKVAEDPGARPSVYPEDKYNADDLTALSTQFIFGHELGHALQRQFPLPNLGMEEDAADGYATWATLNQVGPDPSLAAAMLFDEMARGQGTVTLEEYSSDHPVLEARVFNFLCYSYGEDPKVMASIVPDYLPTTRAPLCPQAWAQLDFGWWTQLQPHFKPDFKGQGDAEQKQSKDKLAAETEAFAKIMTELRTAQQK